MFKRCIMLLADGSRPDVFDELLAEGRLPNIQKNILSRGTNLRAVTAFPSTTGPAHIPFLTGRLPADCNIPGIRWFDRKRYASHGHGSIFSFGAHGCYRSYVGMETFRLNGDMRGDVRTVFEIIPKSYSIFNSINRGVGGRNLTRIMRIWYWYYGHLTDRWGFVDRAAIEKTCAAIERDFEFLFVVLPGIDEFSHLSHPRHDLALKQYEFLDEGVGRIVERLKKLKKYEDTLFWIVSDHGLTETHTHFCVNTFLELRGIRTFYYPLTYRRNFAAANMVSGNGMTHLYFKRGESWTDTAALEDIEETYPGLLAELLAEPAVDAVAARSRDGAIVARTKKGEARMALERDGKIRYEVRGRDPFGYALAGARHEREILKATFNSDYPDAPFQLAHIFSSPRCGDVVVSAAPGFDLRDKYEHPEHKSSHGSLRREHMIVPVICNAPLPKSPLRTADVFEIYLKLLGKL